MRSPLQRTVLAGLALLGLAAIPDSVQAYDRYSPRPPVMYPEEGQAWWMERPTYGAPRRSRGATETVGLMPRSERPTARKSRQFDPAFLPAIVEYDGSERPGTIVIDTESRYLYLVEDDGTARRYGVGVGKPGFEWAGAHTITRKAEWPSWTPPAEMRARRPGLPVRMEGGLDNPLGSRALYLGSSLYRIHGSNEPWSIGKAGSSGCIRMRNEDVEDLYERVGVGTRVVVR